MYKKSIVQYSYIWKYVGLLFKTCTTVSYTHLDVYKRQPPERPAVRPSISLSNKIHFRIFLSNRN